MVGWAVLGVCGCAGPAAGPEALPASASSGALTGDWDDVDAAVIAGSEAIRAVVANTTAVSAVLRRYELRLATGETGLLEVSRPDGSADESAMLELRAVVGRVRDRSREQRLIGAVRERLEQLRGVGAAPIR